MSGHVFHPGHDEWHGQTVVVFTSGPRTVVGRWDAVAGGQVRMMDVAVHDVDDPRPAPEGHPAAAPDGGPESRDDWVARLRKYGIPVEHRTFALPEAEVDRVVRLRDA